MTLVVLQGAGSGALHAVTGPDHLLSLGPAALAAPTRPGRIGLAWGAGHALGTLAIALPLLVASRLWLADHVAWATQLAALGGPLAGLTLLVGGLLAARRGDTPLARAEARLARGPLAVGLVHGLTGAGSLVLVLPALLGRDLAAGLAFLAAFSIGSALAMAALTRTLAKLGARLAAPQIATARRVIGWTSAGLGLAWLAGIGGAA